MGWASGSYILQSIIETIDDSGIPYREAKTLYKELIDIFEDHDCDTTSECLGTSVAFDDAFKERYIDLYGIDEWNDGPGYKGD